MRTTATPEDMAKIKAWGRSYPAHIMAEAIGLSVETVTRMYITLGVSVQHRHMPRTMVAVVKERYPHLTAGEIEARCGIPVSAVKRIVKRYGLRHTPETMARIAGFRHRPRPAHVREKISRKRKLLYRLEYMRLWEGRARRTRVHLAELPRRVYLAKHNLVKKYNYFGVHYDPYLLCYDGDTRRVANEDYYMQRYGLRFAPADE